MLTDPPAVEECDRVGGHILEGDRSVDIRRAAVASAFGNVDPVVLGEVRGKAIESLCGTEPAVEQDERVTPSTLLLLGADASGVNAGAAASDLHGGHRPFRVASDSPNLTADAAGLQGQFASSSNAAAMRRCACQIFSGRPSNLDRCRSRLTISWRQRSTSIDKIVSRSSGVTSTPSAPVWGGCLRASAGP